MCVSTTQKKALYKEAFNKSELNEFMHAPSLWLAQQFLHTTHLLLHSSLQAAGSGGDVPIILSESGKRKGLEAEARKISLELIFA